MYMEIQVLREAGMPEAAPPRFQLPSIAARTPLVCLFTTSLRGLVGVEGLTPHLAFWHRP